MVNIREPIPSQPDRLAKNSKVLQQRSCHEDYIASVRQLLFQYIVLQEDLDVVLHGEQLFRTFNLRSWDTLGLLYKLLIKLTNKATKSVD